MLKHKVKLFKNKDDNSYISGRPGDIMVLPNDDRNEAYMISKTEFEKTHIAKGEEENRKKRSFSTLMEHFFIHLRI